MNSELLLVTTLNESQTIPAQRFEINCVPTLIKRRQKNEGRRQKFDFSDGVKGPNRTLQPTEDGELNPKVMKDKGITLPSALCPLPSALRAKPVKAIAFCG